MSRYPYITQFDAGHVRVDLDPNYCINFLLQDGKLVFSAHRNADAPVRPELTPEVLDQLAIHLHELANHARTLNPETQTVTFDHLVDGEGDHWYRPSGSDTWGYHPSDHTNGDHSAVPDPDELGRVLHRAAHGFGDTTETVVRTTGGLQGVYLGLTMEVPVTP